MDEGTVAPQTPEEEELETGDQLLARQKRERAALIERVDREQREAETETIAALRDDVAASLVTVIDQLRRRLREDREKNELFAAPMYGSPNEAMALERIAQEAAPGERAALVIIPRPTAHDGPDRRAWAVIDIGDVVWGGG